MLCRGGEWLKPGHTATSSPMLFPLLLSWLLLPRLDKGAPGLQAATLAESQGLSEIPSPQPKWKASRLEEAVSASLWQLGTFLQESQISRPVFPRYALSLGAGAGHPLGTSDFWFQTDQTSMQSSFPQLHPPLILYYENFHTQGKAERSNLEHLFLPPRCRNLHFTILVWSQIVHLLIPQFFVMYFKVKCKHQYISC